MDHTRQDIDERYETIISRRMDSMPGFSEPPKMQTCGGLYRVEQYDDDGRVVKGPSYRRCSAAIDRWNDDVRFVRAFEIMAESVHHNAVEHGWWDDAPSPVEIIALCHSELSEALEALRRGVGESEKIPTHTDLEEELADVILRIMDYAAASRLNVAAAIIAKHDHNKTRHHKHGGKAFNQRSPDSI